MRHVLKWGDLRFRNIFLVVSLFVACVCAAQTSPSQQRASMPDAMSVSPALYKLEFDNAFVRVLRVTYGPHAKSPMHQDAGPGAIVVSLTDENTRLIGPDHASREVHLKSKQFRWESSNQGAGHAAETAYSEENLSEHPYETIRIEVKHAAAKSSKDQAMGKLDPLLVDPQHYHLEFENEFVKVIRCRIPPHDKVAMHHHPVNSVVLFLTDQNLLQATPDGHSFEAHAPAGKVIWTDPVTHMGKNMTDKPYEYIRVDLKSAVR
jgi:hypothetical protein